MKKYFGIVSCLLLLSACDDGDLTFDSFDFATATAENCLTNGEVLNSVYKVNNNEALIIKFPTTNFPFKNLEGTTSLNIDANYKIIYRVFNGEVPNGYFCSIIPPVTPTVVDEWSTADQSSGKIEIRTTPVDNTTTINTAKYNHSVIFRDFTLSNTDGGTVTYAEYIFGNYQTGSNITFSFGAVPIQECTDGKLFKIFDSNLGSINNRQNLNEVLILNLPPSVFQVAPGSATYLVNDTNQLTYRLYGSDVNPTALCLGDTPGLPTLYDEWQAEDGVPSDGVIPVSGEIKIETDVDGANLVHTITLTNVKYKRVGTTNNTFIQAIQTFGDYITTN